MRKPVKLIKVDGMDGNNNNKYYHMTPINGGQFLAEYGRVGGHKSTKRYPMSKWHSTYERRLRHGYTDVTGFSEVVKKSFSDFTFSNDRVGEFVTLLQDLANKSVSDTYVVTSDEVTPKQLKEAQRVLDYLSIFIGDFDEDEINESLSKLYSIIPRKMGKVSDHLAKDEADFNRILALEQKNVEVMEGQVQTFTVTQSATSKKFEEAFNIELYPTTDKEDWMIRKLLGRNSHQFRRAFRVVNKNTEEKYYDFLDKSSNQTEKSFWHGSRSENWWSIIQKGLLIKPANVITTGSMFGNGIYFADKAQKSIGYTSLRGSYWAGGSANSGFIALYKVHLGNTLEVMRHHSWCSQLDYGKLRKRGAYDSLSAMSGQSLLNNEYIVYDPNQVTIEYIVELK